MSLEFNILFQWIWRQYWKSKSSLWIRRRVL